MTLSCCASATKEEWLQFKQEYIQVDGRVTDKFNDYQTHSEGQGVGMLMAVRYDDRATFKSIWGWTQKNLQHSKDKLFSWSWYPATGVSDTNNASDGDILIAWSLTKAYQKWHSPTYLRAALEITSSIRIKLLRKNIYGTVLLPGLFGFEHANGMTINLSYWVFPAFGDFAKLDASPDWADLSQTGLRLIQEARFGKWGLPTDWVFLSDNTISPVKEMRFGYDAVRIPLYLVWGNQADAANLKNFQNFWKAFKNPNFLPSWVNVLNNEMGEYNAGSGFYNIANLVIGYPDYKDVELIGLSKSDSYYSYMLTLFTESALEERKK